MDEPFVIDERWLHEWFEWGYDGHDKSLMSFLRIHAEFEEYCDKLEELSEQLEELNGDQ